MLARKRRIPVAQARVELQGTTLREEKLEAVLEACRVVGLSPMEAYRALEAHGWMPDDVTMRGYLREYGPPRPGMLHGPVTWEPPAQLEVRHVLVAADAYARDMVPNACLEDRPVGYWLAYALRKVTDAA